MKVISAAIFSGPIFTPAQVVFEDCFHIQMLILLRIIMVSKDKAFKFKILKKV